MRNKNRTLFLGNVRNLPGQAQSNFFQKPLRKFSAGEDSPDGELNQEDLDTNLVSCHTSDDTRDLEDESVSNSSSAPDVDVSKLKGLRIANLNVNSLLKHVDEIRIMLTKYPFDILAINETKLDYSILDSEIDINGYTIIRKDRNRNGLPINNISYSERIDLTLGLTNLELICVEINKGHCRPFLLSAWYRPPNSEIGLFDNIELF